MIEMFILKHLETNSQSWTTSNSKRDFSTEHRKKTSSFASYHLQKTEFYHNLFTKKIRDRSLFPDNLYLATCDTRYNKHSCHVTR